MQTTLNDRLRDAKWPARTTNMGAKRTLNAKTVDHAGGREGDPRGRMASFDKERQEKDGTKGHSLKGGRKFILSGILSRQGVFQEKRRTFNGRFHNYFNL